MHMIENLPTEQRDSRAAKQSHQACRRERAGCLSPGPWRPSALSGIRIREICALMAGRRWLAASKTIAIVSKRKWSRIRGADVCLLKAAASLKRLKTVAWTSRTKKFRHSTLCVCDVHVRLRKVWYKRQDSEPEPGTRSTNLKAPGLPARSSLFQIFKTLRSTAMTSLKTVVAHHFCRRAVIHRLVLSATSALLSDACELYGCTSLFCNMLL
jgi:hypothetical protein